MFIDRFVGCAMHYTSSACGAHVLNVHQTNQRNSFNFLEVWGRLEKGEGDMLFF